MPAALQAKLLRFLQERVIERVGGRKEIPVDVRVLCATHKDLHELIRTNLFREDLYYRIGEVSITIPALREREGDALLLARVFLERISKQQGKQGHRFSKDAMAAIESYAWPGNVRERENRVKRAVIMAEGPQLRGIDLSTVTDMSNPFGPTAKYHELRACTPCLASIHLRLIAPERIRNTLTSRGFLDRSAYSIRSG